jgi:hypothetical protein
MGIKFANMTGAVGDPTRPGIKVRLIDGSAWDADDPFVRARPDLFTDEPATVHSTRGKRPVRGPQVEQATAAPGELRDVVPSMKRGPGRPRKIRD